jgi:hypothetical protein
MSKSIKSELPADLRNINFQESYFFKSQLKAHQKNHEIKNLLALGKTPNEITLKDEDGDENSILPFYWTDMQIHPTDKSQVIIYGKVRTPLPNNDRHAYVSSQMTIENTKREIYFCLKKGENIKDLLSEVKNLMASKVKTLKDQNEILIQQVRKRYAFELEVDVDENKFVDCAKVTFSFKRHFKHEEVPFEGRSYKGVFGISYTPIELIIIQK